MNTNRYRTQGGLVGRNITSETVLYNAPKVVSVLVGTPEGDFREMWDVKTPNFKQLQEGGAIINSPLKTVKKDVACSYNPRNVWCEPGTVFTDGGFVSGYQSGTIIGTPARDLRSKIDYDALRVLASTQALAEVKSPDAHMLPFLAEIRGTIAALRSPLSSLGDYLTKHPPVRRYDPAKPLSKLSRTNRAEGKALAKAIANQHLQIMFGILPFMTDIQEIMKGLLQVVRLRRTARGFASQTASETWNSAYTDPHFNGILRGTASLEVNVRAGTLYSQDSDTTLEALGLSVGAIPQAVLELTSFSFVLGWVSNVSALVGALTPVGGVSYLAEWLTVKEIEAVTHSLTGCVCKLPKPFLGTAGGDSVTVVTQTTTRTPLNLHANVGFRFRGNLGTSQVLLSLSLITQQLLKY